jgi:hypothetical protein
MRDRKGKTNRRYAIGTTAVIVSLLALSATVWVFRPAALNAETLCPVDRPIEGHSVVIVDRTDIWSPAIGATLTEIIEAAQRNTLTHQKFSIVSLDADQSVRPIFSVCNPGAPSFVSDLYRGRRYTQRDFEERFVGAAERVITTLREPAEAQTSPIIEYVHRWLGADDFNGAVEARRLILISDMRQHSDRYSIYRAPDGAGLSEVVEDQFGPSARGVAFDVYFVAHGQDHDVSEEQVRVAWERALGDVGASLVWRQIN